MRECVRVVGQVNGNLELLVEQCGNVLVQTIGLKEAVIVPWVFLNEWHFNNTRTLLLQIRTLKYCISNIRWSKSCVQVYLNAERRLSILYLDKVLICELGMVDETHRVIVGRNRHWSGQHWTHEHVQNFQYSSVTVQVQCNFIRMNSECKQHLAHKKLSVLFCDLTLKAWTCLENKAPLVIINQC